MKKRRMMLFLWIVLLGWNPALEAGGIASYCSNVPAISWSKDSVFFHSRYEANDFPSTSEWTQTGTFTNENGVLSYSSLLSEFSNYTAVNVPWENWTESYTVEARVKVTASGGTEPGFHLSLVKKGRWGFFTIGTDTVNYGANGYDYGVVTYAGGLNNSSDYHVYRIVYTAGDRFNIWRDGVLVAQNLYPISHPNPTENSFQFGDLSSIGSGTVNIDYVRWDNTGPYAPQTYPTSGAAAADPTTQGWAYTRVDNSPLGEVAYNSNNGGWRIVDGSGYGCNYYSKTLLTSDVSAMSSGWRLDVVLTLDSGIYVPDMYGYSGYVTTGWYSASPRSRTESCGIEISTPTYRYKLDFFDNNYCNQVVSDGTNAMALCTNGTGFDTFRTVSIIYDGSSAILEYNGSTMTLTPQTGGSSYVRFGSLSESLYGSAVWNYIQLRANITRGHQMLIDRGLQIQAQCFPRLENTGTEYGLNLTTFTQSNFTTVNLHQDSTATPYLGSAPGIPWGRYAGWCNEVSSVELPYYTNMVSFQCFGDDLNDITDSSVIESMRDWFNLNRVRYPSVICHDDQYSPNYSYDVNQSFVRTARPDMVMFNHYCFNGLLTGGSPTLFYESMQKFRNLGLAGLNTSGTESIPYGLYLQTYVFNNHVVSESEIRLNQFAAWAFGYKFVSAFTYTDPWSTNENDSILFTGDIYGKGDSNPTAQFTQIATTNDMSRKLGSALVRLISTDVRMKMGRHWSGKTSWLQVWLPWEDDNDQPSGVSLWSTSADPYMTSISATNIGTCNTYTKNDIFDSWTQKAAGDAIIGYFKPLHESFDGPSYSNQKYFMITNGLTDSVGNAYSCRQQITVDFNFGSSGITGLQRERRSDSVVENIVAGGSYSGLTFTSLGNNCYRMVLTLDGGTGDLFKYNTGAQFVGGSDQP
jgi:hypothetical protein